MRQRLLLAFTALLLVPNALAQSASFTTAAQEPADSVTPEQFRFTATPWDCTVASTGTGMCRDRDRRWRFRLPVEDGRIDTLYFHAGDPIVLVYSLTDEESSWGKAVGIMPRARQPRWQTSVAGLNAAAPVASVDLVVMAALGFVGSLRRTDGTFEWRHEYVYDGSGRTDLELRVCDGTVAVTARVPWRAADEVTTCYTLETGMFAPCAEPPL